MKAGTLISFEGVEGSGKSTQARLLVASLRAAGRPVISCREPGGTPLAESIRGLLLAKHEDPPTDLSELYLMVAARAQLVRRVIQPALDDGKVVVTDRYADASLAYQWGGRGIPRAFVEECNRMSIVDCIPEKTILLDLDPTAGFERVRKSRQGRDRMESEALEFHKRVCRAYRQLASEDPERFLVLDGSGKPEDLASRIRGELEPVLGELPEVAPGAGESGS